MSEPTIIKAGIVGGTGYTGVELLRILCRHQHVELGAITSRSEEGIAVAELFPNLRGHVDLAFTTPENDALLACDVVFFATPNGTAMRRVPELLDRGIRVIDLAADFRLRDPAVWERWYGEPHLCPDLLKEAVYGLPELYRQQIVNARLVANPGCYPTAVQLGLAPLLEQQLIAPDPIIADCKSGVSGAGRKAAVATLMAESGESFKAYAASGHRHQPEIEQGLAAIAGEGIGLTFVPHLIPMIRGIHATLYTRLTSDIEDQALQALYEDRYSSEPFVDPLPFASHPETRTVRGSNNCRIALHRPGGGDRIVVLSVIDNLVKGAAGQAVQNMNLMFGFAEDCGLEAPALLP